MKLSTAQSIPVDIYVLILDHLPLGDLASFYWAFANEPTMSQIAKWRCMVRLCNIVTKGHVNAIPVVDGERLYYKQFRDRPFRQMAIGGGVRPTKPFLPFSDQTPFARIFRGSYSQAEMALRAVDDQFISPVYEPIDYTGAPGEVVRIDVTFTYARERIQLYYDTRDTTLHQPFTIEYDSEDEHVMHRTLHHRIPLISATCLSIDDDKGNAGFPLPKDWMEFLGAEVGVRVVFNLRELANRQSLYWRGRGVMEDFEMSWKLRLAERCCTADIIGIWKGRADVRVIVPPQPLEVEERESNAHDIVD